MKQLLALLLFCSCAFADSVQVKTTQGVNVNTTLGSGMSTWWQTPSSANLAATVTGETGSGALVFGTNPTLSSPVLGVATATSINGLAITSTSGSTLTLGNGAAVSVAAGKTVTLNNTLTFNGTDASTVAFGAGGTVVYTSNNLSALASTTSAQLAGVLSDESGSGAAIFSNGPTFTGAGSGTNATFVGTSGTMTIVDGSRIECTRSTFFWDFNTNTSHNFHAGNFLSTIDGPLLLRDSGATVSTAGMFHGIAAYTTNKGFYFKQIASHTGDSILIENSSATALFKVNSSGAVTIGSGGTAISSAMSTTTTWDPASLANGASEKKSSVTLTGVAVGDVVTAALTTIVSSDWDVQACVTATNTVEVKITNNTGGVVDLGSGTLRVNCVKF